MPMTVLDLGGGYRIRCKWGEMAVKNTYRLKKVWMEFDEAGKGVCWYYFEEG
jgi:hypothetical protein